VVSDNYGQQNMNSNASQVAMYNTAPGFPLGYGPRNSSTMMMRRPNNNNNFDNDGQDFSTQSNEQYYDEANKTDPFVKSVCAFMDPCDMCLSIVCPCVTYGQIVQRLDPQSSADSCHSYAGCLMWTGLVAISAAAIEVPLLIPGACSWMPTTYLFDGVLDARQLLMVLPYFVPHWLCHCPLRASVLGSKGENFCTSCMDSTLLCCCSLASLKAWASRSQLQFAEGQESVGRLVPYMVELEPSTEEQSPLTDNSMMMEGIPTTGFYRGDLFY
jgi:hypothetical protein